MRLRCLALLLFAASSAVAASAQIGVYGKLDAVRFSNNVNKTSAWFSGPGLGIYDNFIHAGPVSAGVDLRGNYLYGSNARYRSALAGIRVAAKPPLLPIRPYVEGLIGIAGTRSTQQSFLFGSHFDNKFAYQVLGGLDCAIVPHFDFRLAEVGYGKVSPVSSYTNSPASSVTSLSSGIVLRFF